MLTTVLFDLDGTLTDPAEGITKAVEAALKMMLARFYSLDGSPAPYAGRIPVFLVMADQAGGLAGNYHGTTVVAQTLRGLWPEFTRKMEDAGIYRVVSVPINDAAGFRQAIETWNTPPYKTAGFCHEIIMMNYGAILVDLIVPDKEGKTADVVLGYD